MPANNPAAHPAGPSIGSLNPHFSPPSPSPPITGPYIGRTQPPLLFSPPSSPKLGPYIGCTDGSLEELERVLALLRKYGLRALLDVHAMVGSQNGFDNSGEARKVHWTQVHD